MKLDPRIRALLVEHRCLTRRRSIQVRELDEIKGRLREIEAELQELGGQTQGQWE